MRSVHISLAAVLAIGLALGCAPPAAALHWSRPVTIDKRPPGGARPWIVDMTCPAPNLCVLTDHGNRIVTSTTPRRRRSWVSAPIAVPAGGQLFNVGCGSLSLCVVAAGTGYLLTTVAPTGGPAAWGTSSFGNDFGPISCPTASFCATIDDAVAAVTSTNPAAGAAGWVSSAPLSADPRDGVSAIDCPTVSLCVAATVSGKLFTSNNPAGGAPAWHARRVFPKSGAGASGVSCPTPKLCLAIDFSGRVVFSRHPASTARHAWREFKLPLAVGMAQLSCPSKRLCVAVNTGGQVFTSSDPTAGARAWQRRRVEHVGSDLEHLSCPSPRLCIAVDDRGRMVVGRG